MKISLSNQFAWLHRRRRQPVDASLAQARRPEQDASIEPFEGKVQSALHPVEPPTGFRETLRENLRVAERQRQTGMRVEYPKPIRELVLLTLSLGVVVATITTVLLRRRS
jgi:hypothetical protein